MRPGRLRYSCKFPNCLNSYYSPVTKEGYENKRFYRFPRILHIQQAWKTACHISFDTNCQHFYVCEDHFKSSDFMNERRNRLNFNSVPTVNCDSISVGNDLYTNKNDSNTKCTLSSAENNLDEYNNNNCDNEYSNSSPCCVENHESRFPDENDTIDTNGIFKETGISNISYVTKHNESIISNEVDETNDVPHENPKSTGDPSHISSFIKDINGNSFHNLNISNNSAVSVSEIEPKQNSNASESVEINVFKKGILGKIATRKKDLTPKKKSMYKLYRNMECKLVKLRSKLKHEKNQLKALKVLHDKNRLEFIEETLNEITRNFINSQLRNVNRKPTARRWTMDDKILGLSIYKRSPRTYRYLSNYFQLPSIRTLQTTLSRIPFEPGINESILKYMKSHIDKFPQTGRYCALLFDEISLAQDFYYEPHKQQICGYEDLGHIGRTNKVANHALVFMIRGITRNFKQIVAYYLTANTISCINLKNILYTLIGKLQEIGLRVVATVCDQGRTNFTALEQICERDKCYFLINNQPICVIYDVPHLLKNTRNALLKCLIMFSTLKVAKFQYIQEAFNLDQQRRFKCLRRLNVRDFNLGDSYIKMKVIVAARQLSTSVAAFIENLAVNNQNEFPEESRHTAEFIYDIDCLFDSLNSSNVTAPEDKIYRSALTLKNEKSRFFFWRRLFKQIQNWKLINLTTGKDVTKLYSFNRGWQKTLKSVMFLWEYLKENNIRVLPLRSLNQDPVENLFSQIRMHGIANTNPNCFQFINALKTCVANNLDTPTSPGSNCEPDECPVLHNFKELFNTLDDSCHDGGKLSDPDDNIVYNETTDDFPETLAIADSAKHILNKLNLPNCTVCHESLFCLDETSNSLPEDSKFCRIKNMQIRSAPSMYASTKVIEMLKIIQPALYSYLDKNGHLDNLEDNFKLVFNEIYDMISLCDIHSPEWDILDTSIRFFINTYIVEKKKRNQSSFTLGHKKKMEKFKAS